MGHIVPTTGSVEMAPDLRARCAYLPQQSEVDRSFPISVLDVVLMGHWRALGWWRGVSATQRSQATEALAAVGLSGLEARQVGELSVGQFQRLLFARVLLQDAQLILLDEPFNAIDARTTTDLLALVQRWHGEGRTVIAVLHDLAQVREVFPQTLLLAREGVAWGPTAEVLQAEALQRARQLASVWDENAPMCERSVA
jgi:zinc/manganese transport system ATP-binding protein